jgi:ligand-binding sensor domain-containing protein
MFDAASVAGHPALGNITSAFFDRGSLWLGCDGMLCEVDRAGKLHLYGPQQGIPTDTWLGFLRDRQGTLWVRGVHRVVVQLDGSAPFVARDVPDSEMDVVTDDGGFVEDAAGRVLTRTNHGLARWDSAGWSTINASNGLPEIGIIALLFDRDGALWLGTYGQRAQLVDPARRSGAPVAGQRAWWQCVGATTQAVAAVAAGDRTGTAPGAEPGQGGRRGDLGRAVRPAGTSLRPGE